MSTSWEIAFRWKPQNNFDGKSTLVQVIDWCHQATGLPWVKVDPDLCHHMPGQGRNKLNTDIYIIRKATSFDGVWVPESSLKHDLAKFKAFRNTYKLPWQRHGSHRFWWIKTKDFLRTFRGPNFRLQGLLWWISLCRYIKKHTIYVVTFCFLAFGTPHCT